MKKHILIAVYFAVATALLQAQGIKDYFARYSFEQNVSDSAGNYNLTTQGSEVYSNSTGVADGSYALNITNGNNYFTANSFSIPDVGAVSVWVYNTSNTSSPKIIASVGNTTDGIAVNNDHGYDRFRFMTMTSSSQNNGSTVNNVYSENTLQHLVIVWNKTYGKVTFYVDNEATVSDEVIRNDFLSSGTLYINRYSDGSWAYNGYIDDMRWYEDTLTAAQVDSLYNGLEPPGGPQGSGSQQTGGETSQSTVDIIISHNQYALITNETPVNDVVARWDSIYTVADTASNYHKYSIVSNPGNRYAIDVETGWVTLSSAAGLTQGTTDNLVIRSTIGSWYYEDTMFVRIIDEDSTRFINVGGGGSNSGTRANPYTAASSFDPGNANYKYWLIARGSTVSNYRFNIPNTANGSYLHSRVIGAYGSTANYAFIDRNSGSEDAITLRGKNWSFYSLSIREGLNNIIIHTSGPSLPENILISDVESYDCYSANGCIYSVKGIVGSGFRTNQNIIISDVYVHDAFITGGSQPHGIKMEASGFRMENVKVHNVGNDQDGISIPIWATNVSLKYILSYNNTTNIEFSVRDNGELSHSIIRDATFIGVDFENDTTSNVWIHHNIFNANGSGTALLLGGCDFGRLWKIEDNLFNNANTEAIQIGTNSNNIQMRRNTIRNSQIGIHLSGSADSISMESNLIYSNETGIHTASFDTEVSILGNTIVKNTLDIDNDDVTSVEFRGNIFQSTSGTLSPNTNNYDNDAGDVFSSYAGDDFSIADSTKPVVDAGYDFGQVWDILGNPIKEVPDIGAYEYQYPSDTTLSVPETPSNLTASYIDRGMIKLQWTDNSDNEEGFKVYHVFNSSIPDFDENDIIGTALADSTSFVDTSLANIVAIPIDTCEIDIYLAFAVKAFNAGGESELVILEAGYAQSPILSLEYAQDSGITVFLAICPEVNTSYILERSVNNEDNYEVIANLSSNVNYYTDNGIEPTNTYYYRAFGHSFMLGTSYFSNTVSHHLLGGAFPLLAAPTHGEWTVISQVQIDVNWQDNSSKESGFIVEREVDGSGNFLIVDTLTSDIEEYADQFDAQSPIESGLLYNYRIIAFDSLNNHSDTLLIPVAAKYMITLSPIDDATAYSSYPEVNFNYYGLGIGDIGSYGTYSFLKFDISSLQGNVTSAKLKLTGGDGVNYTLDNYLDLVSDNGWDETLITYSNMPSVTSAVDTQLGPAIRKVVEFELTDALDNEISSGDTLISLRLSAEDGSGGFYYSKEIEDYYINSWLIEAEELRPALIVETDLVFINKIENLSATPTLFKRVVLSWEDRSNKESGFLIERSVNDTLNFEAIDSTISNSTTFEDQTPSLNDTNYYRVMAFNDTWQSDYSNVVSAYVEDEVEQVTLSSVDDSYVRGGTYSSETNGTYTYMITRNTATANDHRLAFIKFDVSEVEGGVNEAVLRLNVGSSSNVSHEVKAVSNDSWTENSINYNNMPSAGSSLDTAQVPTLGEWIEFDVTDQVETERSGDGIVSFQIAGIENAWITFCSKEHADTSRHPRLVVNFGGSEPKTAVEIPESLNIYPNPFNDELIVEGADQIVNLEVYSLSGELLLVYSNNEESRITINTSNLRSGYYLIKIVGMAGDVSVFRIVKN